VVAGRPWRQSSETTRETDRELKLVRVQHCAPPNSSLSLPLVSSRFQACAETSRTMQARHEQEKRTLLNGRRVVRRRFGLPKLRAWELRVLLVSLLVFVGVYMAVELTKKRRVGLAGAQLKLFKPLFAAKAPPETLFPYTDEQKAFLPPMYMAPGIVGSRPIPTNNWWGNMIAATQEGGVQPIWANPYSLQPTLTSAPYGLVVSYPYPTRVFGGGRTGNGLAEKFYLHGHSPDFTFSAAEFSAAPTFEVFDWDDLSVQVRLKPRASGRNDSNLEATLVSGMAFVTAKYAELTPRLHTINAILTVNGQSTTSGLTVAGDRFVLTFNNGQTWALYFSSPVTLQLAGLSTLESATPFTGIARVAFIPDPEKQHVFDQAAGCILEGGSVEAQDSDTYAYVWRTSGSCQAPGGLLHYAQLHHVETLDRSTAVEAEGVVAYSTTRGPLQALLTTTASPLWRFTDSADIPISFYPPRSPSARDVEQHKIKETLVKDIAAKWKISLDGSYYFNGKAVQKYASLCLMAADPAVTGTSPDSTELLRQCLTKLKTVLAPFLTNAWKYVLKYDTVYRGILSSQGFALHDVNADFGNTMYNDHHYHYGYWIVTAAIVNKLDPAWSGLVEMNRMASFLVRDVANPSWGDPYFTKFRSFDWFRGHSYSHGVLSFADGKDQESSSEDVNFHYGIALFGQVTGDEELASIGRLMVKVNARAIQTYFLLTDASRAQPALFRPNKVTGILFDNKVDYATWFSPEKYAIHGIQMIPISPVTEYVRTQEFVSEEWDQVVSKIPDVLNDNLRNPWLSLLYANYATVNKTAALVKLESAKMDDGLSRSWALYMAATRPIN